MADPSVRLSASGTTTADGDSCAVSITGTPADGELILFILSWNESPAFSTPTITGFSVIASIVTADWNPLYIFGKIASSEGANPTYTANFTSGANDGDSVGVVLIFQNAAASLPTNTASTHDTSASTTFSIPALTTTKNGSYDLVAVTGDGNSASSTPNFSTWGSSLVELFDINDDSLNYGFLGVAGVTRASAGSQAATTVTSGVNDKNVALRIEVEPVAASGATGTIAATLQKATAALTGGQTQTGTIAATLQKATASLVGVMQPSGTIAATLQKATAALAGTQAQTGAIAATAQPATASLTGTQTQTGTIAAQLQAATASLVGAMQPAGVIAGTLQPATASLVGTQEQSGPIAATLQAATASLIGVMQPSGPIAASLQPATAALAGSATTSETTGAIGASLQPATAALTGEQQMVGVIAATLQAATGSLTGAQSQTGQIAATLQIVTAVLFGGQTITGTVAAALQAATASLAEAITQVIGLAAIADEATARAILNDSRVSTATLRDELTAHAQVRD